MSDAPKEMSLEVKWADTHRVQLVLINRDKTLHSDYCDPRSVQSRNRAIDRLLEKFPALNREDIESELLHLARTGPPKEDTKALSAVEADPDAWPDEVDGAELLNELVVLLRRFIILPPYAAETCALWIVHTFVFGCFEFTPRLLIHSPDKRCGKSRLLRLLHALARRALSCESISAPALFRSIEAYEPTLFLDEADTYLSGRHVNEDLRGVINAGHQRGGKVIRCVGDNAEPTAFNCFAPVAIAMIGKPPGTVEDRSIPVAMRRKMPGEFVEKYAPGQSLRAQLTETIQRCVRWANDNRHALCTAQPSVPSIDDRAADCWFALLAIADQAGGDWPKIARTAAIDLMGSRDSADSLGVQLLQDLRNIFDSSGSDRLSTAGLLTELERLDERPWPEIKNGKPITAPVLARLLKPFGITSKNIRLPDGSTPKGYVRADCEEPWSRYLPRRPEAPPAETATPPHTCGDKGLRPPGAATADPPVADENGRNPLLDKGCGGVAGPAGGGTGSTYPPELEALVAELADELDTLGTTAPFDGNALRRFYRDLLDEHGPEVALADARARAQRHLLGELPALRRLAS